jgi:glycosyltransferase involved in cell wall biosynthesis
VTPDRSVQALVVTNMYPSPATPALGTFVEDQVTRLRETGVNIDLLCVDRAGGGRGAYRGLGTRVQRAIDDIDPDLVHVMYGGVMADVVTRTIRDRPVLVAFCGSDLLGGHAISGIAKWSERYGVRASARAARRATGVVVKSRNLFEALPPGLDEGRTWVLPDGVDLGRFRPLDRDDCRRALGLDPDRRHVLFPAAPDRPEKRYALARAAVARLDETGAHVQLHALGRVPHDDVPTWMNAADAVLLTSMYEGSPNVIKEALACNVPVVSVDVGDVRELVQGIDGCFVAEPVPEDLAAKLGRVLERSHRIDGRPQAEEVSLDRITARLVGIYASLINGSAAPLVG